MTQEAAAQAAQMMNVRIKHVTVACEILLS